MTPFTRWLRALLGRRTNSFGPGGKPDGLKGYGTSGEVIYQDTFDQGMANMLARNTTSQRSPDPAAPALNQRVEGTTHMSHAYLSLSQAAAIRQGRQGTDADRKAIKKEVFAAVREGYGIPANIKFTVEVDPSQPGFRLLKDKTTRQPVQLNSAGTYGAQTAAAPAKVWVRVPKADVLTAIRGYVKDIDVDSDDVVTNVTFGTDATSVDGLRVGDDGVYVEMDRDDISVS